MVFRNLIYPTTSRLGVVKRHLSVLNNEFGVYLLRVNVIFST